MPQLTMYEAMSSLRAVRRLKPDPIPTDVLERVLQAAAWAPTGGNRQPWRIILVTDPAPKAELGKLYAASWKQYSQGYQARMANASDKSKARDLRTLAAGDYLADHFHQTPAIAVFCFNPEHMAITDRKLNRVSVVGGGSVYPAVQNLLLACRTEGLGCVLTTLLCEHEDKVREILAIPQPWGTAAAVPMGYPVATGHGPIRRYPVKDMVYANRWGTPRA
jgi:nitroreductase